MRTYTKPLPTKIKSLRIEKSMVKTKAPKNKLGLRFHWYAKVGPGKSANIHDKTTAQSKTDMQARIWYSALKETRLNNEV